MAEVGHRPSEGTCNFAQMLKHERDEIAEQCKARGVVSDLQFDGNTGRSGPDMLGLAFSGGGIRSSCVGMGVLQRLARAGMLRQTHYISGISGGGYLLGWLSAWTQRTRSLGEVEAQLGQNASSGKKPSVVPLPAIDRFVEPMPIHYLRRYSSYLTPRVGLVSGDTLAMISVYLRNLFLNQVLLVASLVSLTLVLQLLSPAILWHDAFPALFIRIGGVLFFAIFAIGVATAGISLNRISQDLDAEDKTDYSSVSIFCGLFACALLWLILPTWYADYQSGRTTSLVVILLALFGLGLTWRYAKETRAKQTDKLQPVMKNPWAIRGSLLAAWIVFAALCWMIDLGFHHWLIHISSQASAWSNQVYVSDTYVVFGLPVLLMALTLQSYLFIGVLGTALPDAKREWLARAAGYFLLFAGAISLLLAIALWGPVAMHLLFSGFDQASWRKYLTTAVLPGGWLFVVLTGLLGANSAKSNGTESQPSKLDFIIAVAPPVFLVGLLLLVSWGTHGLVRHTIPFGKASTPLNREYLSSGEWRPSPSKPSAVVWSKSHGAPLASTSEERLASVPLTKCAGWLHRVWKKTSWPESRRLDYFVLWLGASLVAVLLAFQLDVNEFSLHLFYRNRLVRAFLGASRVSPDVRRPSPFTGFAVKDDIALADLTVARSKFQGPYPIWGTTLNLTTGEDLAWQQRKGASFVYSPLYCGWDYIDPTNMPKEPEKPAFDKDTDVSQSPRESSLFGYRATGEKTEYLPAENAQTAAGAGDEEVAAGQPVKVVLREGYGGCGGKPYIGTAMAASGAAVSPNSGYHTRPGVAALLAIFNLRLGWWTGNPRNPKYWKRYAPSITYLIAELLGLTDDHSKYVYLSDGGHFENLGLYELVRRKVRFIICSDADADPSFTFTDLGNAIDKCRRDFGVEIHVHAQRDIAAEGGKGFRSGHYAIGEIVYPGQTAIGYLLYIKSSLTNDEPSDVLGMKAQDAAFPHDTTANQFFNESMFESYRALGEHMIDVILTHFEVDDDANDKAASVRKLYQALVKQGNEQKKAEAQPKSPPLAVAVTGGVSVQIAP